ncbi:Virulence-regulating protein VirS [Tritonibacter multivorans]|uniref:Virulence-regulating protein VirS n=1 Tax=Tritonibacter multivorans TaxID=928856 RepID=A0A0N7LYS2_9RHOB|nr:AraC family transcriptional regulator [Tritonibacter multivorans]MDA7419535.1 AraC family transcriptional regulator ligand-binding domain-containing protein [Tritonibacter multivorans]CUH75657.1 Virulence-regulating protein VirS [Tritonibacter multivorans]SFC63402.1 AraC-type DNA-binding protein [Tritonibacter multivorans]
MTHGLQVHGGFFAQQLARKLIDDGYAPDVVLAHIPPERRFLDSDNLMMPLHEHASFLEQAVDITGNHLLGVEFAATQDFLGLGVVGYLFQTAPTMGAALSCLAEFSDLFSKALRIKADNLVHDGRLEWHYEGGQGLKLGHCAEFTAHLILQGVRRFVGPRVQVKRVVFSHSRTEGLPELTEAYGVRPEFGRGRNLLEFSTDDLAAPMRTADPQLHAILRTHATNLLDKDVGQTEQLVVTVERVILQRLPEGKATLPQVARELGMSARTLSRRLSHEDTSFFIILEGLRRALAFRYLKEPGMTLADVSYYLGYSSLSSFNDAFKRWTGKSPGQYRLNPN